MNKIWIAFKNSAMTSLLYAGIGSLLFSIIDFFGRLIYYRGQDVFYIAMWAVLIFLYSLATAILPALIGGSLITYYFQNDLLTNKKYSEPSPMKLGGFVGMIGVMFIIVPILIWYSSVGGYQLEKLKLITVHLNPVIRAIEAVCIAGGVGTLAGKKLFNNYEKQLSENG